MFIAAAERMLFVSMFVGRDCILLIFVSAASAQCSAHDRHLIYIYEYILKVKIAHNKEFHVAINCSQKSLLNSVDTVSAQFVKNLTYSLYTYLLCDLFSPPVTIGDHHAVSCISYSSISSNKISICKRILDELLIYSCLVIILTHTQIALNPCTLDT